MRLPNPEKYDHIQVCAACGVGFRALQKRTRYCYEPACKLKRDNAKRIARLRRQRARERGAEA